MRAVRVAAITERS